MAKYKTVSDEVSRLYQSGVSLRAIAKQLGLSFNTTKKACLAAGVVVNDKGSWKESADTAEWSIVTKNPIKTLEDAVKSSGVDLAVWFPERWEQNSWTVVAKDSSDNPNQYQNYQVKVFWKRIVKRCLQEAQDAIFERMRKHAPRFPKAFATKSKGECLAVAGLFDVHFGKYAWGEETGTNFDVQIAEEVYTKAVEGILAEVSGKKIGRWLLPVGNDFFHMDNSRNTTFAGTPLDVDGRYARVIESGEMAVIKAIERMMAVAPVDVVWVPGNHDPTTSYHLCRTIAAWYRNTDRVEVDIGPSPRKYYRWGNNIIGLTHGNEEKIEELPNLMASERPDDWAACKDGSREWLIGHWHQSKRWVTKATATSRETIIRGLMSLSGTDSWHHRKGYVNTAQAAEVYFYKKTMGYAGHVPAYARV